MAQKKYYAVKIGKVPGVYETWDKCKEQVHGFPGAIFKSFPSREEAEVFAKDGSSGKKTTSVKKKAVSQSEEGIPSGKYDAIAYVDGSYNVATGEYSCGVVFLFEGKEEYIAKKGTSSELAAMRNVAGEIMGSMEAMKLAVEKGVGSLCIYHDYQGISSWCNGHWKTNKEGTKAYKEFYDSICSKLAVDFVKVKGHSGDHYNDKADELAKSVIM